MSFAVGLGFSAVAYSLFVLHTFCMARKTGFTVMFSTIFFYGWLFSFELLAFSLSISLSLLPKKSLDLW